MVDLVRAAETAQRLIEAHGRSVTLYKANRDPDDAAKPWRGTSSTPAPADGGLVIPNVLVSFVPAGNGGQGANLLGRAVDDGAGSLAVVYEQIGLLATDSVIDAGYTAEDVEACDLLLDTRTNGETELWNIVQRGHLRPASNSVLLVLGLKR